MLFLLALLILGIVWVASALIDNDAASMESLYGMFLKDSVSFVLVNMLYFQGILENTIWETRFFTACKVLQDWWRRFHFMWVNYEALLA